MTIVKTEEEELFTPESRDLCCQAYGNGDNSLVGACLSDIAEVISSELIYDDINMCRTRIVTKIDFTLPVAMTIVRSEN